MEQKTKNKLIQYWLPRQLLKIGDVFKAASEAYNEAWKTDDDTLKYTSQEGFLKILWKKLKSNKNELYADGQASASKAWVGQHPINAANTKAAVAKPIDGKVVDLASVPDARDATTQNKGGKSR